MIFNKYFKAPLIVCSADSKYAMFLFFSSSDVFGPIEIINLIPKTFINSCSFLMVDRRILSIVVLLSFPRINVVCYYFKKCSYS